MEMSERIRERRTFMGYTQEELGQKLGLQKSAIAKYENGRVENIKRSVISNMAKVLECSPCYLMGWENSPKPLSGSDLSYDETRFLVLFRSLNADGQHKMMERAEELRNLGYIKGDNAKMA